MTAMNTADYKPPSSCGGKDNTTANGLTSHLLGGTSQPKPCKLDSDEKNAISDLPLPSRFALAILGHWFPKKEKAEAKPLAFPYEGNTYGTVKTMIADGEKSVGDRWMSMNDDSSSLITCDGNMNIWENRSSIRKRIKGYSCFDVIGLLYLFCSCCMMIYDLEMYFRVYWGVREYALHFVTYTTFLIQVMVVPYWCLYARMKYRRAGLNHRSVSIMSRAFFAHRIKVIRQRRSDAWILSWWPFFCILAWPVTTGFFRILYDYFFRVCRSISIHGEVGHWNSLLGLTMYGCFCYIVYLERRSFEIETHQIFCYAMEQATVQNIDAVLTRIRVFSKQYKLLRKLIRRWMAFTIVVSTIGLTSHIIWNYLVFSQKDLHPQVLRTIYFLNALVTCQKITFIVVPYFALGGLNVDHIWRHFREDIIHCREHKCEKYWKTIVAYVKDINKTFSGWLTPSLISTGIGMYLGLNVTKSQDIGFWVDPSAAGCNLTDPTGM